MILGYHADSDLGVSMIQTHWIIHFTGSHRSLKLVHTDRQEYIRFWKIVHTKVSQTRYMCLWNVCLPMQKVIEETIETDCN